MNNAATKYLTLYRKYRPKNFDEIKGQDHIVRTLKNIIESNKISHAYLFSGPRGTGKTSLARIFSLNILCHDKKNDSVSYKTCLNDSSWNVDIIEMDAASNNGVDEIRDLKEKVLSLPFNSKYKIYIIDEVHMLSKNAFNALLKLLEEPPKHIIFILATTDAHKIPLTILSRLQKFNFKRIEDKIIKSQLIEILTQEKVEFEDEAVHLISKMAKGSLRDALSIADQSAVYSNNEITLLSLLEVFGIISINTVIEILQLISNRKVQETLNLVEKLLIQGVDINLLVSQMIEVLKDYIFYKKTYNDQVMDFININEINKINLPLYLAYSYLNILYQIYKDLQYSQIPNQTLEIGLIKLIFIDNDFSEEYQENIKIEKEETIVEEKNKDNLNLEEKQIKKNSYNDTENLVEIEKPINTKVENVQWELDPLVEFMHENNEENKIIESLDDKMIDKEQEKELFDILNEKPEQKGPAKTKQSFDKMVMNSLFFDENEEEIESKDEEFIKSDSPLLDNLVYKDLFEKDIEEIKEQRRLAQLKAEEQQRLELEAEREIESQIRNGKSDYNPIASGEEFELSKLSNQNMLDILETPEEPEEIKNENIEEPKNTVNPELINLIALAERSITAETKSSFAKLLQFENEKYNKYISFLSNTSIFFAGNNYIVLVTSDNLIIENINSFKEEDEFKYLINDIFNKPLHVFVIDKKERDLLVSEWQKLDPKPEGIPLKAPEFLSRTEKEMNFLKDLLNY